MLRHVTLPYKSSSCHLYQRAWEWEAGDRGISSLESHSSKSDPDLTTDRQVLSGGLRQAASVRRLPSGGLRQASPTAAQT